MGKKLVDQEILHLQKNTKIVWKDIKHIDFQDSDELVIGYDEGYVSENNSWDAHYYATVTRKREETDEEYNKRIERGKRDNEEMRKRRYENYLKLKKEFEGE
jgi:hypothetical protein